MYLLYCKECNKLYTEYYSESKTYRTHVIDVHSMLKPDPDIMDMEEAGCSTILNTDTYTLSEFVNVDDNSSDYYEVCPSDHNHDVKNIEISSTKLTLKEVKEIFKLRSEEGFYTYFDLSKLSVEQLFKLKKLIVDPAWR